MVPHPNSPQVRITDVLRHFAYTVTSLNERRQMVIVPDDLMSETNPQARLQRLRLSPERYVVRSIDISPQWMRSFQAVLRDFIDIASGELQQLGVKIPEIQTILSYYGSRRELDRATLLSPSFARALHVVLDHPVLRSRLSEIEQRLMSRNRQHYTTIQQACKDQTEQGSRLFVIGVDRYILQRLVERTTVRATHHQIVERPQTPSGAEAQMLYLRGTEMLAEMDRARRENLRSRIQDLFRPSNAQPEFPFEESPVQQAIQQQASTGIPGSELVREVFEGGRLTTEASERLAESMGPLMPTRSIGEAPQYVPVSLQTVDLRALPKELADIVEAEQSLLPSDTSPIYRLAHAVGGAWVSLGHAHSMLVDPHEHFLLGSLSSLQAALSQPSQVPFGRLTLAMDAVLAAMKLRARESEIYPSDVRDVMKSVFSALGIDLPVSEEMIERVAPAILHAVSSKGSPYPFTPHASSNFSFVYSWSNILLNNRNLIRLLRRSEWSESHPVVLAFRALGYDYTPEQVGEIIHERVIASPSPPLTAEQLSHLPLGLSSIILRVAESGSLSAEDLDALAYEMSGAYGQEDVYTGRVYVLLPGRERVEAFQADVRDFPLPRLNVDLGFEQEVLHPRTEGLLWRGENLRRIHAHVSAGNPLILTEEQFKRMFSEAIAASERAAAYSEMMRAKVHAEGSVAANARHAVGSEMMERARNLVDFLFEAMEVDDEAEEEGPYDRPAPETVLSWDADDITAQVMYRRRIGRGRSERVIRGSPRRITDVMPEQLLIHMGGEAERRARALLHAIEQLERRGEYTAAGPMGSLIQVQEIDREGNLVIREWTLEEYLRHVAPQAPVSPIPASAFAVPSSVPSSDTATIDDADLGTGSQLQDDFRAQLALALLRRADYEVLFGGADLVSMFHGMENAYSRTVEEKRAAAYFVRHTEELLSEILGEDVTLNRRRLYESFMAFQDRIPPERKDDFIEISRMLLQFRESLMRNLQDELSEFVGSVLEERHLRNLASRLIEAYPDYAEHGLKASGFIFSRFIFGLARERVYQSDLIERLSEPVIHDLVSAGQVGSARFAQGVNLLARSFGMLTYDERTRRTLAIHLYRELVSRGVDVFISDLTLKRLTGLSMNELNRLVPRRREEGSILQLQLPLGINLPPGYPPRDLPDESDSPSVAGSPDLQLELPIFLPEGAPIVGREEESVAWRGSDEMLEALGFSETNQFGAARRRFMRIFGWEDERSSEWRRRLSQINTQESIDALTRLFTNRYGADEESLRLADQAVFAQVSAVLRQYAPGDEAFDRLSSSVVWNPANFAISRALYHLITDQPQSRLSIALRRTYLGAVGSTESGADMLTDLGLAAFHFAAEFVRTTPPGAKVGTFGIMPSDPDEVAQFLSENLLGLMIRHALRQTSREEAFGILREMSLEQPVGEGDEDVRTVQDVIADHLTVRSPEHGGPALREELVGGEEGAGATSGVDVQTPSSPRPSRYELVGYVSPHRLEGGISEALIRQEFISRHLRTAVELLRERQSITQEESQLSESARSLREGIVREARRLRTEVRVRNLPKRERPNALENLFDLREQLTSTNRRIAEIRSRRKEIGEALSGIFSLYPESYREHLIQDFIRDYQDQFASEATGEDLAQWIRSGIEQLSRGDAGGSVSVDKDDDGMPLASADLLVSGVDAGEDQQTRTTSVWSTSASEPAASPASDAPSAPQQELPISFTTGYLRYVSDILSDLEAGRIGAVEARRALRGAQLFAVGGHVAARVPIYIGDEEVPVTVFPGGRVSLAGRTLSLEERDPYPIAPEMINPIPQQVMRPVDPVHERVLPALIWVRHEAQAAPGLAMDVGLFGRVRSHIDEDVGLVALDIETDPETNAFLQGALVLYSGGGGDIGREVRLVLSDVDREIAVEQLEHLVHLARQTQPNYRRRAGFVMRTLGLDDEDLLSDLQAMFREGIDAGQIALRLAESPGVLLSEQEALSRYIQLLTDAARRRQLVVQNVAFDIPYLIERAEQLSLHREAEMLTSIPLLEAMDVAEMASVAGYGQVNLEYLGRRVGVLAAEQREAHLALDDAILAAQVERALSKRMSELPFEPLENRYLVGLGPGRLYALDNPFTPEQVTGLRDRIFRVVQAGYSLDQMRALMELEEIQFQGGEAVPVRRLRFEPMLDESQPVQPMWQASQELNRMFTVVDEEEARRVYEVSMRDLFRREVERILAPDLPPAMTVRHDQLPSEYEREGLITSIMTVLRARAISEGIPDPTDAGWLRETLGAEMDDELALHLVQRAAYYFTTPYSRDPRRQEIYRQVWSWWTQEGRRERLGALLSELMRRGEEQQLSWAEMTAIWRDVISLQIERAGLPQVETEVPFYRQDTAGLAVALSRGGFATVSLPLGISEQAQEEWLLHRVRTQLRRQVLASRFGLQGEGSLLAGTYQSFAREDVALLSMIDDVGDYESALRMLAERRSLAIELQRLSRSLEEVGDLESAEAVDIQNWIQEHMRRMRELEDELQGLALSSGQRERFLELRRMYAPRFLQELNRDRRLREALDDYILRVVLPVDTAIRASTESGERVSWEVPSRESAVSYLLGMARAGHREEQRVSVEQFVPSDILMRDMEERWESILQRARARTVSERVQQTLEDLGVRGFRVTEADISTRIPLHAAALALHDAVSELAARGEPVTLADISELVRRRLGVDVLQVGRYHTINLTSPDAALALLNLMRRNAGWIGRYTAEIDEEWLEYISRQMYHAGQLRGINLLGASGVVLDQPTTTPFSMDVYSDWVRSAWGEITSGTWSDISSGAGDSTGAGGIGSGDIGASDIRAGDAGGSFNLGFSSTHGLGTLALSFADDLFVLGAGAVALSYAWYRIRKRRRQEEEQADEVRLVRRGTGISGATRFLVQANPFIRQPAHHIPIDSDYRRPSSARLRRMERDMEELL